MSHSEFHNVFLASILCVLLKQCRQQYKDLEVQFANLQGKSKEVILSLQKELEEQKAEKVRDGKAKGMRRISIFLLVAAVSN